MREKMDSRSSFWMKIGSHLWLLVILWSFIGTLKSTLKKAENKQTKKFNNEWGNLKVKHLSGNAVSLRLESDFQLLCAQVLLERSVRYEPFILVMTVQLENEQQAAHHQYKPTLTTTAATMPRHKIKLRLNELPHFSLWNPCSQITAWELSVLRSSNPLGAEHYGRREDPT